VCPDENRDLRSCFHGKADNENQLAQLREFAGKQGWAITHEYIDTITGSGKKAREQFDDMMDAASKHQFDCVLFWKLDRFSREGVRRTLLYLTQVDGWNVGFKTPVLHTATHACSEDTKCSSGFLWEWTTFDSLLFGEGVVVGKRISRVHALHTTIESTICFTLFFASEGYKDQDRRALKNST
jgi:hypothetical protein